MSTFPDGVFQYGGMPVGGGRYEGMWGSNVWFVDYDNGTAGAPGDKPDKAQKYLQTILDKAAKWETVYIRPRDPDYAAGSPNTHLPASTTNWSISYLKWGLSLIGTGVGHGLGSTYGTVLRGTATAGTTPALFVYAPLTNIENISFHRGGSTYNPIGVGAVGACVAVIGGSADTYTAYQNTFTNCSFWDNDYGSGGKSVGLHMDDAWYLGVHGCQFIDLGFGITIGATATTSQGIRVTGCDFMGLTADIKADIYSNGGIANSLITNCNFNHVLPTGGSPNKYLALSAASTGLISNCFFGTHDDTPTDAELFTLNGLRQAHNYTCELPVTSSA